MDQRRRPTGNRMALLWAIVVLEIVVPFPAALTIGAIVVLLTRPRWFYELVRGLYAESG